MRHKRSTQCALALVIIGIWSGSKLWPIDAAQTRVPVSATVQQWEKFDFARHSIELKQIQGLSLDELKYLRGIVFGRHGRVFGEKVIQNYLASRPWYKPNSKYRVAALNNIERGNMDVIKAAESWKHQHIQPGDLRIYRNRLISGANLGHYTLPELRIMQAEIEAWHGKRFDDQPWLQSFFEERYWYHPVAHYSASSLSALERQNLALLAAVEKRQRHLRLAPGGMKAFQQQSINAAMLNGLGLYEARLLRNEVYALHGQRFHTPWLQEYFEGKPWYQPLPDYSEPSLSPIERKNVDIIIGYENRLHRELATKPVLPQMLKDLSPEDARKLRNEIYARRGRTFKDPLLHDYFASLPWYQPSQRFNERMLSDIEKRNAAQILAYEKHARALMSQVAA